VPQSVRLPILLFVLALSACDGGGRLSADKASAKADGAQMPPLLPASHGRAPRDIAIRMLPEGGSGETASFLVLVSPACAVLSTGQKTTLTAITDDRFGVRWSVFPRVRAITPSSSYNRAAVVFAAPENPGIYTVTATSMTNPTQSSSATIVVRDVAGVYAAHDDPARDRVDEQQYAVRRIALSGAIR